MRLKGKVALVTGGTSGIGEATALLFAAEGAKVAITGRNEQRGAAVVAAIVTDNDAGDVAVNVTGKIDRGGVAIFYRAVVSVADDCKRAVEEPVRAFGRLDILFNNAGVYYPQT